MLARSRPGHTGLLVASHKPQCQCGRLSQMTRGALYVRCMCAVCAHVARARAAGCAHGSEAEAAAPPPAVPPPVPAAA
eukprot:scaffold58881_cov53-Phaeocystis_antarctica.AAC.1